MILLNGGVVFTREVNDKESDLFSSFFDRLYSCRVRQDGNDKMVWILPSRRRGLSHAIMCYVLTTRLLSHGSLFKEIGLPQK